VSIQRHESTVDDVDKNVSSVDDVHACTDWLRVIRVLHVIPSISAVHGGPSLAVRQMSRAMVNTDILLEVATTDDDGPGKRLMPVSTNASGVNTPIWYFRKVLEFYKVAPGFMVWFWRHAREYDVVHIHALFSFLSVVAAGIAVFRRVPYIVRPLGTLSAYGVARRRPFLKRVSIALIEGPLLRRAAFVHFTSEVERKEAEGLGIPFRGVVIPLAVESCLSALPERGESTLTGASSAPTVLYLSRLDPKKNVESLLRALCLVLKESPATELVIAGSGDDRYVAALKQLASDLGISAAVKWAGYVSGDAKAALLRDADLFALPSYSENFGIAVAEALAAGLPCVVSSGVAISSEIAEYGAGAVVSTSPESIAVAIINLIGDLSARRLAAEAALRLARERFSMAAMGSRLAALYNEISHCRIAGVATKVRA
jgi:glycosyltransferase involved in cell wall biosynthesis